MSPMNPLLAAALGEVITAISSGDKRKVDSLEDSDPLKAKGQAMSNIVTVCVNFLRRQFPNSAIRELMGLSWDIIGHNIVSTMLGPAVPTLSFVVFSRSGVLTGVIVPPEDWVSLFAENPAYQLGALVFVGSQAVDFYNDRYIREGRDAVVNRCRAYEAEFIRTYKQVMDPEYALNDYQAKLCEEFPRGLSSEKVKPHLYKSRSFVIPS